jgi:nitroimidazol reductase NimA-like FMN-containing flavoprotein (pyridoxamine 5'-phosphate oxidase superfamily)
MLAKMKDMIKENSFCVLATVSEGKPHCSFMSYVSDDESREIFMISQKQTKKYANLVVNPSVSILIDTRQAEKGDPQENLKALTVEGEFQIIHDLAKKDRIRVTLLKRHPHLLDFINDPGAEIFSIKIKSFQLLDGLKDAYFEKVD